MFQEVEKIKLEELSSNLNEASCNIKEEKEESSYNSLNIGKAGEQNKGMNLFGVRLLFCSILLWSLLFIKESDYGKVYVSMVTQVLTKNIEIEPVQEVVNKLTIAIQQLI